MPSSREGPDRPGKRKGLVNSELSPIPGVGPNSIELLALTCHLQRDLGSAP